MNENYINSNCGFYVKFYWNIAMFVYIVYGKCLWYNGKAE